MLATRNPHTVYRAIEFDARVAAARAPDLVRLCYEHLIGALGRALLAHERGDNRMKSEALTRAVSALTALHMGVSGEGNIPDALHQLYLSARRSVLDSAVRFDAATIARIRGDIIEIAAATTA